MSGSFRSQEDLVNEALDKLGVTSGADSVNSEDYEKVAKKVDPMIRELAALNIVYIADEDNIPGEFFDALAAILAGKCAANFGSTPQDRDDMIAMGLGGAKGVPVGAGAAVQAIRMMTYGRPTYETLRTEYF